MSQICKASYKFTEEGMIHSMTAHYGGDMRKGVRVFATVFFSLFLLLVVFGVFVMLFDEREDDPTFFVGFIVAALASIFFIVFINCRRWWWIRKFRKRIGEPTTDWEFEENVFRMRSDFGESSNKWQVFLKIVETDQGFLFYVFKNIFFWLPYTAFESPECIDTVRRFIIKNKCQFIQRK